MLTEHEAKKIVLEYLNSITPPEIVLIEEKTIERPHGWIFFYQTKEYFETAKCQCWLMAYAPAYVEKANATITILNDFRKSSEETIREFEASSFGVTDFQCPELSRSSPLIKLPEIEPDQKAPVGMSYLLTKRRAMMFIQSLPATMSSEIKLMGPMTEKPCVQKTNTDYITYCYARIRLSKDKETCHLRLELWCINDSNIGKDADKILLHNIPKARDWISQIVSLHDYKPDEEHVYDLRFCRKLTTGTLLFIE